jgi:hypothetical protein
MPIMENIPPSKPAKRALAASTGPRPQTALMSSRPIAFPFPSLTDRKSSKINTVDRTPLPPAIQLSICNCYEIMIKLWVPHI